MGIFKKSFMKLCSEGPEAKALKVLKNKLYKLSKVDSNGMTPLMLACHSRFEALALEMLKYPDMCRLYQVNTQSNNALQIACYNRLEKVAIKFMECTNSYDKSILIIACQKRLERTALKIIDNLSISQIKEDIIPIAIENNLILVINRLKREAEILSTHTI